MDDARPSDDLGLDAPTVILEPWRGGWDDDDPDANFKHDVALYSKLDPLSTISNLADRVDVPVGALCRYILAKWASAGAEALLALGPTAVVRMAETIEAAEAADSDGQRLEAYHSIASQISWLRSPLDN